MPGIKYTKRQARSYGGKRRKAVYAQERAVWIAEHPKIGLWTLLRDLGSPSATVAYIACRCACGVERDVAYASLRHGRSHSCGNCNRGKK
jgi:hypothetical protein